MKLKPLEPTTIRRLLRGVALERSKLSKLHAKRMEVLDAKRLTLQQRCPHNWESDIDPADGRISWECVICGKQSATNPR